MGYGNKYVVKLTNVDDHREVIWVEHTALEDEVGDVMWWDDKFTEGYYRTPSGRVYEVSSTTLKDKTEEWKRANDL